MKQNIIISLLLLFYYCHLHAESANTVQDNRIVSQSTVVARSFLGTDANSFVLNLPDVNVELTPIVPGLQKSGVVYQLPTPITSSQLTWEAVDGGYVARIHLFSVQAKRLRFHLVFHRPTPSIVFRLKGSEDTLPLEPIDQTAIHNNDIWLPITNGNNAELELFVNDKASTDGLFSIDSINIIVGELNSGDTANIFAENIQSSPTPLAKAQSLFLAQKQEYDLACWSGAKQYPALQAAAGGTAKINFIANGGSYICTGTLLNDNRSSRIPWFATANHCLTNQAIADTVTFEWLFQATSCGGFITDSRYTQTYGGARLLWSNVKNDLSFLKLNALPPGGTFYMGWDSKGLNVGNFVWGVHHPEGDHTMVSAGRVRNLSVQVKGDDNRVHTFNKVRYIYGATEGGSSGSGVFFISKGSAKWRGTLYGVSPSNSQISYYSNFNSYYPYIKRWLVRRKKS